MTSRSQLKWSSLILAVVVCFGLLFSTPVFGERGVFELSSDNMPPDGTWSWDVALGDMDGDDDLDVIFSNDGQERLYINDSSGLFTDVTVPNLPEDNDLSWGLALGDVDGDGDLDVAFANTGQNKLYINDGFGVLADATLKYFPRDSEDSRGVALGDVDGDGDLDAVFANRLSRNRLYINDGSGVFRDASSIDFPADGDNTRSVTLGDVDSDGDLDVVFGNKDGQNRLYLNNGSGVFSDVTEIHLPGDADNSRGVTISDVDGDDDMDIIFANGMEGQNKLYINDGFGVFSDTTTTRLPVVNYWSLDIAVGDVDGDRDSDIIFADFTKNKLYLNDGFGVFTDVTSTHLPAEKGGSLGVALGDMDGDGDPELIFANSSDDTLYINLGRRSVPFGPVSCAFHP